jgi:hypothetical protein
VSWENGQTIADRVYLNSVVAGSQVHSSSSVGETTGSPQDRMCNRPDFAEDRCKFVPVRPTKATPQVPWSR